MPASRIQTGFEELSPGGRGGLLPYLTAGFPSVAVTERLVREADSLGAAVVELGIPFSDSIADGPVIQDSFHAVLERGQRLETVFELVSRLRDSVGCGLVAMVSYTLVFRYGLRAFMARAAAAGFDGVILPDVPVEESAPVCKAAAESDLCHIGLVAPTTTAARREAVVGSSSGFVYQIAVAGTTGERSAVADTLRPQVASLREITTLPICVGFGIASVEQVRAVCNVADGAIVGSAIVRRIADGVRQGMDEASLVAAVGGFMRELMDGTQPLGGQ